MEAPHSITVLKGFEVMRRFLRQFSEWSPLSTAKNVVDLEALAEPRPT